MINGKMMYFTVHIEKKMLLGAGINIDTVTKVLSA
jgi:hypothetical protein